MFFTGEIECAESIVIIPHYHFHPHLAVPLPMAAITRLVKRTSPLSSVARGFSSHAPPCKEERNVQWVFLGCPGVGKGTYASRLCNLLGVPHIATGDLVRHELASNGPLSSQVSSSLSLCLSLDSKSHVFITVIVDLIEFQFRKLMSYATQSENTNLMLDCIMVVNYEIIL